MAKGQEIQTTEKQEVPVATEPTREGPVYQPAVDIFERPGGITLLADMPGVRPDGLTIDLRENVLTIQGAVRDPQGPEETIVMREFGFGSYFRQFSLADTIDQEKIEATLRDGVLRLELPKVEKAQPRQIAVKAG